MSDEDEPVLQVFVCGIPSEPCVTCKFSIKNGINCEYELGGARKGHRCGRHSCRACGRRVAEKDYCGVHASIVEKDLDVARRPPIPRVILKFATGHILRASGESVYDVHGGMHAVGSPRAKEWERGRPWAPSWGLWCEMNSHATDHGREAYRWEMLRSYRDKRQAWNDLLNESRATIVCTCKHGDHCHRTWLAEFLVKLGATYTGEL